MTSLLAPSYQLGEYASQMIYEWTGPVQKVTATQDIVEPSQRQGFNVLLAHVDEDEKFTYPYQLGEDALQMICQLRVCKICL